MIIIIILICKFWKLFFIANNRPQYVSSFGRNIPSSNERIQLTDPISMIQPNSNLISNIATQRPALNQPIVNVLHQNNDITQFNHQIAIMPNNSSTINNNNNNNIINNFNNSNSFISNSPTPPLTPTPNLLFNNNNPSSSLVVTSACSRPTSIQSLTNMVSNLNNGNIF